MINNPPDSPSGRDDSDAMNLANSTPGKGGGTTPSQPGEEKAPPAMFPALDERNLSTLVTKSMYSVVA